MTHNRGAESALTMTSQQVKAAEEFANRAIAAFTQEAGKLHPPTLIAAVARMAGVFLFRSFGFANLQMQPGQAVFSDVANEEGPLLMSIAAGVLARCGVSVAVSPQGPIVSESARPHAEFLETQRQLEPLLSPIQLQHGLTAREAAHSAAAATALLIQHCAKVLDPSAAFGIAVFGFVEGSKTAPDPVVLD